MLVQKHDMRALGKLFAGQRKEAGIGELKMKGTKGASGKWAVQVIWDLVGLEKRTLFC